MAEPSEPPNSRRAARRARALPPSQNTLYRILVDHAAMGLPCPSNASLAAELGVILERSVSDFLAVLVRRGLIVVETPLAHRQVTIVATGQTTAPAIRPGSARGSGDTVHRAINRRANDRLKRARARMARMESEEEDRAEAKPQPSTDGSMQPWDRDWYDGLDDDARTWQQEVDKKLEGQAA